MRSFRRDSSGFPDGWRGHQRISLTVDPGWEPHDSRRTPGKTPASFLFGVEDNPQVSSFGLPNMLHAALAVSRQ
jgi:hypothetical protein